MSPVRRAAAIAAALIVAVLGLALGSGPEAGAAPAAPAAATTGCRSVAGGAVDMGGGPNRATVVVDTGSGAVWSACISFSGTISGVKALELADATIADLDPVYDTYAGEGRAVCRLRGVGTDPPDCLGKSVDYWGFFVNGTYARGGAGTTTVRDGDVHAWRYGSGRAAPRRATAGTEATAQAPATTTTTRPAPATTAPPVATTRPAGSLSGQPGGGSTPTGPDAPGTTAVPAADGSSTTVAPADAGATTTAPEAAVAGETTEVEAAGDPSDEAIDVDGVDDAAAESAAGASETAGSGGSGGGTDTGGSSSAGSLGAFAVALALVGAAGVLVRRRRIGAIHQVQPG